MEQFSVPAFAPNNISTGSAKMISAKLCLAALSVVLSFLFSVECHDTAKADGSAIHSVAELEQLPVGLKVVQSPETAKAVTKLSIDGRPGEYTWVYRTEVIAIDRDLTIVEFGAFHWDGTEWQLGPTVTGTPFGTKEFAEWYSCENGTIRRRQSFADPVNWHSTNELVASKTRWFFIGVDNAGKRFRGDAVIEFAGDLGERSPWEPLARFSGSWKKQWKLLPSEWKDPRGAKDHNAART
jgi:hypothetical protein